MSPSAKEPLDITAIRIYPSVFQLFSVEHKQAVYISIRHADRVIPAITLTNKHIICMFNKRRTMMITTIVTATEMQNNFEMYLNLIMLGQEVIVTVNGKEIGRFVPKDADDSYLTDSLTGILKGGYDLNEEKTKRLSKKYGSVG